MLRKEQYRTAALEPAQRREAPRHLSPAPAARCRSIVRTPSSRAGPAGRASYAPIANAVRTRPDGVGPVQADRSALPALRRASRPCVRRRAATDRQALLHERRGDDVPCRLIAPSSPRSGSLALLTACSSDPSPAAPAPGGQRATAVFAGGCFWCTESDFDKMPGVISTVSGYTGGKLAQPDLRAGVGRQHRPYRVGAGHLRSDQGQLCRARAAFHEDHRPARYRRQLLRSRLPVSLGLLRRQRRSSGGSPKRPRRALRSN